MKMQRKQFRIGQLAKKLDVERFVIRFWEKEFNIKPTRSEGGQRFYEEKDFNTFCQIKDLLYNQGFTINGAKQKLFKKSSDSFTAAPTISLENQKLPQDIVKKLLLMKKQLQKLESLL